ncbi:MAG: Ig-like domain-containing protein [Prevotellaceae bacterium]|jgi:hypothetical protein|nr:Ig-like domain-containing protein [Prevotellaceae bacterium]
MKKKYLFAFLSMILLGFAVLSCSKGDDDGGEPGGGNGNPPAGDLKAGQVQIKGYAHSSSKKITFYATAKKLTIDWGDGQKEEITPNGNGREFSHEYENATNFQTISINTEELTEIGLSKNTSPYGKYDGDIYELRFGNCSKLTKIDERKIITAIDGGGDYSYNYLNLSKLTVFEINRAESLEQLRIEGTDLTELNLNGCINLKSLDCRYNSKLTSLDVSRCTKLEESLDCRYNSKLTSLDVSGCTNLTGLDCHESKLTSLDVSKCTNLTSLVCYDNQLTSLNVSGCTKLESLQCYYNQLTSLDVSKCTRLTWLSCSGNQLSATVLNSLFTGLPVRTAADNAWISCYGNPGYESCNKSIAENKGWIFDYPPVWATGVTLNKTMLELAVRETETLTATVTPDNATDKTVTWTSSASAIATVTNGVIIAVAAGSAAITAITANGKTATCALTVR